MSEWRTEHDRLTTMITQLQGLKNKKVKVGVLNGEHAWLARIHEFGCTIVAKRAQYLTVPIHPGAVGKRAREIPGLFVFTAKGSGEKFLAKGSGDNLEFFYWLTPLVQIPERSFIRAGHDKYAEDVLKKARSALNQILTGQMSQQQYFDMVGHLMATKIKKYARDLRDPPKSSATLLSSGSSNPLVDTGNMIEHITWEID